MLPHSAHAGAKTAPAIGYADFVPGDSVTGWAIDPMAPDTPLRLRAVIDGEDAGETACTLPRHDVRAAGIPFDTGGFRYAIPPRWRDGHPHGLRLRLPGGGAVCFPARDGSLATEHRFCLTAQPLAEGCVDAPGPAGIEGWALRRAGPDGAPLGGCEVAVLLAGAEIARLPCHLRRDDVAAAEGCPPLVGFRFVPAPQLRSGRTHSLEFVVLPERTPLRGSPVSASFPPGDAAGRIVALAEQAEALFAQAWRLRQSLRALEPPPDYTLDRYDAWARRYQAALRTRVEAARVAGAAPGPLVTIVCPVFRPDLAAVMAAIESVRRQTHPRWELILVDDGSRQPALSACLRAAAATDSRIRLHRMARRGGIAAATNAGIARAGGEWIAFLDHDDLLEDLALEVMLGHASGSDAALLYSDEDKLDAAGRFAEPHLKGAWNARLALDCNFVRRLTMVRADELRAAGPLDPGLDGAQDLDLVLRISERVDPARIVHVPEILYHRRAGPGSAAADGPARPQATAAGLAAVRAHLARRHLPAEVSSRANGTLVAVRWRFAEAPPVRIIVPFRDQAETTRRCVQAVLAGTDYPAFELLLIDNGSTTPEAAALLREMRHDARVRVLRDDGPFNYARLNNRAAAQPSAAAPPGAAAAAGAAAFLLLLNNDVFVLQPDWLRRLVDEALADPRVAAVGCKLLYPDRRVQHAGVVLGVSGVAGHAFCGEAEEAPGYAARAWCAQEYMAVTAACMLLRAEAFAAVGGLDQDDLPVAFNDVDLCLKLRRAGWRVVFTPDVVAEHHESLSRGDDMTEANLARFATENLVMHERWGALLGTDPFYSRHFSRHAGPFSRLADESLIAPGG